jgi:hypothetical protein
MSKGPRKDILRRRGRVAFNVLPRCCARCEANRPTGLSQRFFRGSACEREQVVYGAGLGQGSGALE